MVSWVQSQSNELERLLDYKEKNQNWINIYVLSFKDMEIMASYCSFIHMNVKEFKPKIHLKILSLSFDLGPLKVNNNASNMSQFCKGLSKILI